MVHKLALHSHCAARSIDRIEASVEATPTGCRAEFVMHGDITAIKVPPNQADGARCDDLWRTTCFEIFWQPKGITAYREFNLSPSSRWACYDFDEFRQGMRNAAASVDIGVTITTGVMRLQAHIESDLSIPASVALNAIIEDVDGANRFWALAFPDGKPEFHSAACRAIEIAA